MVQELVLPGSNRRLWIESEEEGKPEAPSEGEVADCSLPAAMHSWTSRISCAIPAVKVGEIIAGIRNRESGIGDQESGCDLMLTAEVCILQKSHFRKIKFHFCATTALGFASW